MEVKEMGKIPVITKFRATCDIYIPELSGYGWAASMKNILKAGVGDIVICETNQLPDNTSNDSSVKLKFTEEGVAEEHSFETLGRLIACGSLLQET